MLRYPIYHTFSTGFELAFKIGYGSVFKCGKPLPTSTNLQWACCIISQKFIENAAWYDIDEKVTERNQPKLCHSTYFNLELEITLCSKRIVDGIWTRKWEQLSNLINLCAAKAHHVTAFRELLIISKLFIIFKRRKCFHLKRRSSMTSKHILVTGDLCSSSQCCFVCVFAADDVMLSSAFSLAHSPSRI